MFADLITAKGDLRSCRANAPVQECKTALSRRDVYAVNGQLERDGVLLGSSAVQFREGFDIVHAGTQG